MASVPGIPSLCRGISSIPTAFGLRSPFGVLPSAVNASVLLCDRHTAPPRPPLLLAISRFREGRPPPLRTRKPLGGGGDIRAPSRGFRGRDAGRSRCDGARVWQAAYTGRAPSQIQNRAVTNPEPRAVEDLNSRRYGFQTARGNRTGVTGSARGSVSRSTVTRCDRSGPDEVSRAA